MRIRELRIKHGYTQNYAASCLHICQNTYSRYENGKRQIPTHLLLSLADLYHTSTDYILGLTDNPIPHLRNPTKGASSMPKITSILCLLDIETGDVTELKRFPRLMEAPFFRGENELLYNAGGRIFRLNPVTGETGEIPTGECIHCNNDHVLSPDGTMLAVSHSPETDWQSRIYILGLDPVTPPRLVTPLGPSYLHGWSPDGKNLAYCASRGGEYDVYTIPACGGEETRLTDAPGLNDGPEYSPDGKYIYFNSVRSGLMDCWRMDADGRNPVRLTDNGRNNWFPHISPDGTVIAYISYDPAEVRPDDHPANKNVEIRRMNPDGTDDRTVVKFFGGQGSLNVNSWMPDSRRLAFVKYELIEE